MLESPSPIRILRGCKNLVFYSVVQKPIQHRLLLFTGRAQQ